MSTVFHTKKVNLPYDQQRFIADQDQNFIHFNAYVYSGEMLANAITKVLTGNDDRLSYACNSSVRLGDRYTHYSIGVPKNYPDPISYYDVAGNEIVMWKPGCEYETIEVFPNGCSAVCVRK